MIYLQKPAASPRQHKYLEIAIVLLGAFMAGHALGWPPLYGIDDAQITQVYARNIAEGFGYTYNIGGERVEGSTSLLWTVVNAVLFNLPSPRTFLLFASFLITWATVNRMARIATIMAPGSSPAIAAICSGLALIALDLNFFVWSVWSLMDEGIYVLVVTAMIAGSMTLREDSSPGNVGAMLALFALAPITRPEGFAVCAALSVGMGAFSALAGRRKLALVFLGCGLAAAASLAIATGFRMLYFGYPVPNTYYAKVSTDHLSTVGRGAFYVANAFRRVPLLALGALLAAFVSARFLKEALARRDLTALNPEAALLIGCAAVIATTVLEGGDHFKGARLLQPIAPVFAALAGALAARLAKHGFMAHPTVRIGAALAAAAAVLISTNHYPRSSQTLRDEFEVGKDSRRLGRQVREISARFGPTSLGVVAAGGSALEYRGMVFDLEGLNWIEMAHATKQKSGPVGHDSFSAQVLYRHVPDILPLLTQDAAAPRVPPFLGAATKNVASEPRFRELYVPARFDLAEGPLIAFVSRAWLQKAKPGPVTMLDWSRVQS